MEKVFFPKRRTHFFPNRTGVFPFDCVAIHQHIESGEPPVFLEWDGLYVTFNSFLRSFELETWAVGSSFGVSGAYHKTYVNENAVVGAIITIQTVSSSLVLRRYDNNGLHLQTYITTPTFGKNIWFPRTSEIDRLNDRIWVARDLETTGSLEQVKIEEYNFAGTLLNTFAEESAPASFRTLRIFSMRWDGDNYLYYLIRRDIASSASGVREIRRLNLTTGAVDVVASTSVWSAGATGRIAISPDYIFTTGLFTPTTTLFRTALPAGSTDSVTDAEMVQASVSGLYYDWKTEWLYRVGSDGAAVNPTYRVKRMREDFSDTETLLSLTSNTNQYTGIQNGYHPFPL